MAIRSRVLAGASAFAVSAGLLVVPAVPASATSGCTGTTTYACVDAAMGSKNYNNKTQYVGTVKGWGGTPSASYAKQEIWGDGFYYSTSVVRSTNWTISKFVNRWVRSGTNICSATTYSNGYRKIACIRITV